MHRGCSALTILVGPLSERNRTPWELFSNALFAVEKIIKFCLCSNGALGDKTMKSQRSENVDKCNGGFHVSYETSSYCF